MSPEIHLPEPLDDLLAPLFDALPLNDAMPLLVVDGHKPDPKLTAIVAKIVAQPEVKAKRGLAAALWLYVDDLDRSHTESQADESPTGSYWHAIMHRREGDFSNSKYWYRRVGHHPAMPRVNISGGSAGAGTTVGEYEPYAFVDRVERCVKQDQSKCHELVSLQRHEWLALFQWCVES